MATMMEGVIHYIFPNLKANQLSQLKMELTSAVNAAVKVIKSGEPLSLFECALSVLKQSMFSNAFANYILMYYYDDIFGNRNANNTQLE